MWFAEAADETLVHFADLDLHSEALHNEVNDPVVLIRGLLLAGALGIPGDLVPAR